MIQTWDAATYDEKFAFVSEEAAVIVSRLGARAGEQILDLGCGTGELTARLAATGAEVVGLDADGQMIDRARVRFPALRFIQADAEGDRWPAEVGICDAVFSNAALHWMQPAPVLAAVRKVLRPGGRFVGELGGLGNVATIRLAIARARAAAGLPERASPWFFPSIATFAGFLEEAGFEARWLELVDRPTPMPGLERGLHDWLAMFGSRLLDDVPPARAAALVQAAVEDARPTLLRAGVWHIDYRRLRFEALASPLTGDDGPADGSR
jgi:SAM-dependent methyltransferase